MNMRNKRPDRIFVTKQVQQIKNRIDEKKYLGLDNNMTDRIQLFLFAMALGISTGCPTKLDNQDSFVLDQSIKMHHRALMYALYIGKLEDKNYIDQSTNLELVYDLAQRYANTGFSVIEDYINSKQDSVLQWELIKEMDEEYNAIEAELCK